MRAKALRIGIAVGEDAATAVVRGRGIDRTVRVPLVLPTHLEHIDAIVATAFGELATRLAEAIGRPATPAHVHLALLPPLCDARLIELPPLRQAEAEAVIRRDAARHFVGGAVPSRVVSVLMPRTRGGAPRDGSAGEHVATRPAVLACAAPTTLVDAVRSAAVAAGWSLKSIVPAHAAWLAAPPLPTATEDQASTSGARVIVAMIGDTAHVMRLEGASPTALRRVPNNSVGEVVASLGAVRAERLDAQQAAAEHAHAAKLELVPATLIAERRRRDRARARRLAAVSVVLLAGIAGVELWGAQRELDSVRARRAEIRDEVAPLLVARDSLNELEQRVRDIQALSERAPQWTRALFDLALLLPPDAYLTGLDASGDTIDIEAAGARAASAIQALRDAESLRDLRLQGIVERELEEGTTAVERFKLRARLSESPTTRGSTPTPAVIVPTAASVAARRAP
jgi:hypothetical protein